MPTSLVVPPIDPVLWATSVPCGQNALEPRLARLAPPHDIEQQIRRLGFHDFSVMEPDPREQCRHGIGRRGIARIFVECGGGLLRLVPRNRVQQFRPHLRRPLVLGREILYAIPIGNQARGGPVHVDAGDAQLMHACGHRFRAAGQAQQNVGRAVVADQQHQLHQVADGQRHARLIEELGERAAPGMKVGRAQLDHLIEFQFAGVDTMQQLDGDRDLESAGHREPFVPVKRHFTPGFKMHGARPDYAARNLRNTLDFTFEPRELRIGGYQCGREEERGEINVSRHCELSTTGRATNRGTGVLLANSSPARYASRRIFSIFVKLIFSTVSLVWW